MSVVPPPSAKPLTAAMKIAGCRRIDEQARRSIPASSASPPPASRSAAASLRSTPLQKLAPRPGDDDDLVPANRVQRLPQRQPRGTAHGVALVRAVDADQRVGRSILDHHEVAITMSLIADSPQPLRGLDMPLVRNLA